MTVFMSLFLGLIQGITEFLPISSSGHLSILQNLLNIGYSEDGNVLFTVLMHLGTLISIIAVYRKEIQTMLSDALEYFRMRADSDVGEPVVLKPPARALLFVLVGTIPLLVVAIFSRTIERLFSNVGFIGFALIITGGLLFVSDKYIKRGNKTEKTMTLADALIIGLAQAAAVVPGLSRSGTTIAVGLTRGLTGSFSVRFSLLLSIPAVIGATIIELYKAIRGGVNFALFPVYLAGFIVATVVGFFAIQLLRRLINKSGFGNFAYYCWAIGVLAIVLSIVL